MEPSSLANFLNGLVKTRDFIFSTALSIPTFLLESKYETIITFLEAGESSIVAAILGMMISKINDSTFISWKNKKKAIKNYNKFLGFLKTQLQNSSSKKKSKSLDNLIQDTKTTIEFYNDKLIDLENFKERFKKLIERYESIA